MDHNDRPELPFDETIQKKLIQTADIMRSAFASVNDLYTSKSFQQIYDSALKMYNAISPYHDIPLSSVMDSMRDSLLPVLDSMRDSLLPVLPQSDVISHLSDMKRLADSFRNMSEDVLASAMANTSGHLTPQHVADFLTSAKITPEYVEVPEASVEKITQALVGSDVQTPPAPSDDNGRIRKYTASDFWHHFLAPLLRLLIPVLLPMLLESYHHRMDSLADKQAQADNAAFQEHVIELESSQEELLEQIASDISQRSDTPDRTLMLLELIYEAINEDQDQPSEADSPESHSDPQKMTDLSESAPDLSAEDQK